MNRKIEKYNIVIEKCMMIEQSNLPLEYKITKKIEYYLNFDIGYWWKEEYDTKGNLIYLKTSAAYEMRYDR